MLEHRPFDSLGRFENDWLQARYHFSFSNYYDPNRQGLGPLLVWNDDRIRSHSGFGMHPHRNMEIITYIRKGALSHSDHLGNAGRTAAGQVQVMSAGRGIMHAEHNREDEDTLLYQIWIKPNRSGHDARWETQELEQAAGDNQLQPLASGRPEDADSPALKIHQNAALLVGRFDAGATTEHHFPNKRQGYLVVSNGHLKVTEASGASVELGPGDGLIITETDSIMLTGTATGKTEVILVDLPET